MKQRDKNLIKEHESHGWRVLDELSSVVCLNGDPGKLMKCSCGWLGWVRN